MDKSVIKNSYPKIMDVILIDKFVQEIEKEMNAAQDTESRIALTKQWTKVLYEKIKALFRIDERGIEEIIESNPPHTMTLLAYFAEYQSDDLIKVLKKYYETKVIRS